jgi:hypothetical protein
MNIYDWSGNKDFDIAVSIQLSAISYQPEGKISLQEELQRFSN